MNIIEGAEKKEKNQIKAGGGVSKPHHATEAAAAALSGLALQHRFLFRRGGGEKF